MFWKKPGETLAVMLRRFREEKGLTDTDKMTYAGRLDPMAEGIVPLLVGEARFQKERLMAKQKTYEVGIALGLATDSGDMLGLLTHDPMAQTEHAISDTAILDAIQKIKGITELPYPQYSSRPVEGKPLFMHARAGKTVVVPIKKVTIYSMELLKVEQKPLNEVLVTTIEIIEKVQGDFRQPEIMAQWKQLQKADGDRLITIVTIRTTVSSGTYMRSLAEKVGELLGVPALAYTIVRTNIES